MSTSDDGYGGDYTSPTGQTRTRLPENEGDSYGSGRRSRSGLSSRNLIAVVGVVVLLIAAIAFANRGSSTGPAADTADGAPGKGPAARPTAPTGTDPVTGRNGTIAAGFAKTEQGAQSAAANYAVALGSSDMFDDQKRHRIVSTIMAPSVVGTLQKDLDHAYATDARKAVGLKPDGSTPAGLTFISRTIPIGTKSTAYAGDEATVDVWCTGLLGMAGTGSTRPVTTTWFTITMKLTWTGKDWKAVSQTQKNGPAPVSGDVPASGAKEIAGAVEGFGGFTYAR
ncbi:MULTISPECIES: hypothetical protein [Streptomyces]|uniref:DUF8175 domain-containing protein n=1 Tax=Streptomyces ramulosus TaxID=47762 RepID=A0ABW1FIU6_9ACTN